jgi:hypothetical protein
MGAIISITITIILTYYFYNKSKQEKMNEEMDRIINSPRSTSESQTNMDDIQNISTRDLCVNVLRKLNCDVQFDEEDSYRMSFTYQGETFQIDTWKDGLMILIWDTWWGSVDLDDLDDVSRIRKAINTININSSLTLVYSIDQENQRFAIHTKRQCLFIPQIPNIENYLSAMLSGFFEVQRSFKEELDKLRKEDEITKNNK